MDDYTEIIEKLKIRKKAMGLTYKSIADKTGYHHITVRRMFGGEGVGIHAFFDVCKTLGIEVRVV